MDTLLITVIIAIIIALIFDVINGFHDAANSIATIVSTKVLSPRFAVMWAAFFNFAAMFVFAPKVADTIAKIVIIDQSDLSFVFVVIAGLLGAIFWDLLTWWFGIPVSSSHALMGGLAGAGIAYKGMGAIRWEKLGEAIAFIPLAPLIGAGFGFLFMILVYWLVRKWQPNKIDNFFRKGQLFSAALYSLGHGGNDAQKTMGIIIALLIAISHYPHDIELRLDDWHTLWVILSCHVAMAIGTGLGGWKIVKTMGMKLTRLRPVHGFAAESAGAATLYLATALGIPVSTTHTIAGAIVGVGSTTNLAGIKWEVASRIVLSWIITIPFSAFVAALFFYFLKFIFI